MPVALITGGSAGFGRALVHRSPPTAGPSSPTAGTPRGSTRAVAGLDAVVPVVGDVADPAHLDDLEREVAWHGRLDLLVHNASTLGPLPLRPLREYTTDQLLATWRTNAAAPVELTRRLLPQLRARVGHRRVAVERRRGRALRDLGCLRRRQGRARPPDAHAGRRGGS